MNYLKLIYYFLNFLNRIYFFIAAESQLDSQSLQDENTLDPVSPQDTVDDDNRSSSSSQDLLQSMDEISSGSLSPDTTDRASPLESGIGTASPPRSTDRRLTKRKLKSFHYFFVKYRQLKVKSSYLYLPFYFRKLNYW